MLDSVSRLLVRMATRRHRWFDHRAAFLFAALLLAALPLLAQTITNVTGTVQDPNGIPFAFAPVTVTLNGVSGGVSPIVTATNAPVIMPVGLTTNASGTFSTQLVANASITPSGTTYNIRVCTAPVAPPLGNGGATCVTISGITISGATQDTSTTFTAAPPPSLINQAGVTRVATAAATTQAANIGATTVFTVPANLPGSYRMTCFIVVTQAASTSSTLPNCNINVTDVTGTAHSLNGLTSTNAGNTVGTIGAPTADQAAIWQCQAGSAIQYQTNGYASSGATVMQYSVFVKLEYLGP